MFYILKFNFNFSWARMQT